MSKEKKQLRVVPKEKTEESNDEVKVLSKEDINYLNRIKLEYAQLKERIVSFELAIHEAVDGIKGLQAAEKEFTGQLYIKHGIPTEKNVSVDMETGNLTITDPKKPVQ